MAGVAGMTEDMMQGEGNTELGLDETTFAWACFFFERDSSLEKSLKNDIRLSFTVDGAKTLNVHWKKTVPLMAQH